MTEKQIYAMFAVNIIFSIINIYFLQLNVSWRKMMREVLTFSGAPEAPCVGCRNVNCGAGGRCHCTCHRQRVDWFNAKSAAILRK